MKSKITHSGKEQEQALYDPDPITILLSIVTALTPVGALIVEKRIENSRENKRRIQDIRNALFSAARALNETERVLKDFVSYLDQQGLLDRDVRLGGASIIGDYAVINEAKTLYKDSYNSGRKLNDAVIELSRLLENRDFNRIRNISGSLDEVFQQTLSFKKYKDFAVAASRLIRETRNLIVIVGEGYDFNPTTSLS